MRGRRKRVKIEVESRRETALLGDGFCDLVQSAQAGSSLGQGCPTTDLSAQLDNHATETETERFFGFASRMRTKRCNLRPWNEWMATYALAALRSESGPSRKCARDIDFETEHSQHQSLNE